MQVAISNAVRRIGTPITHARTFTNAIDELLPSWYPPQASFAMQGSLAARQHKQQSIDDSINGAQLPSNCRLEADDVLWANEDLCFVGVGLGSNFPGVRYGIANNLFQARRVAVVRDVFDRTKAHASLRSIMSFGGDNVACLINGAQKPPLHRLVNEYTRLSASDTEYSLTRHDVGIAAYLTESGFRKVVVPDANALKDDGLITQLLNRSSQSTNRILMVAPTSFKPNVDAAKDNHFMASSQQELEEEIRQQALREYANLHAEVLAQGIDCHLFTHEPVHDTPDALFPNNWFSTHSDLEMSGSGRSTLVLYPMKVPNRRNERRPEFLQRIHFRKYQHTFDLTEPEEGSDPKFLEGTGSLVLDRVNRVAYLALSERSNLALGETWAKVMGYDLVPFTSVDKQGRHVYHTNVIMCVGTSVAIVCAESVPDEQERARLVGSLKGTGHEVLEITLDQVEQFCGNALEVENVYGEKVLAMSTAAYEAFGDEGRAVLHKHFAKLLHADIRTIEKYGGGGVRCAIAELF